MGGPRRPQLGSRSCGSTRTGSRGHCAGSRVSGSLTTDRSGSVQTIPESRTQTRLTAQKTASGEPLLSHPLTCLLCKARDDDPVPIIGQF